MSSAVDQLLALRDAADRFDIPRADLLPVQLAAANERLEAQLDQVPLLANRAKTAEVTSVTVPAELVPLLFAHNTYKTFAEAWLTEGMWDRMARWLQTVSTYQAAAAGFENVDGLDDWVTRLETEGMFIASSSGTTGKPAMIPSSEADIHFAALANNSTMTWATGLQPVNDCTFFGLGPRMNIARNELMRQKMLDAFGSPTDDGYQMPVAPISVGSVMEMILLRRRVTDGVARPAEVAEFERLSRERQREMEAGTADTVAALVKARDQRLLMGGFLPGVYALAVAVREAGFNAKDYRPDNILFTAGGLKGATLPPDFREFIDDTFNLSAERVYQMYSMQELNSPFPSCSASRYHVPPWVMPLPLDTPGERLLDASEGEIEARAAFLDLSLDGRWGGIISGDKITVDFRPCRCGHQGPSIGAEIVRYADLEAGDKITCAGTIDAYVRGAS